MEKYTSSEYGQLPLVTDEEQTPGLAEILLSGGLSRDRPGYAGSESASGLPLFHLQKISGYLLMQLERLPANVASLDNMLHLLRGRLSRLWPLASEQGPPVLWRRR